MFLCLSSPSKRVDFFLSNILWFFMALCLRACPPPIFSRTCLFSVFHLSWENLCAMPSESKYIFRGVSLRLQPYTPKTTSKCRSRILAWGLTYNFSPDAILTIFVAENAWVLDVAILGEESSTSITIVVVIRIITLGLELSPGAQTSPFPPKTQVGHE